MTPFQRKRRITSQQHSPLRRPATAAAASLHPLWWPALAACLLLLLALAGCSSQADPASPQARLADAYQATAGQESAHFTIAGVISADGARQEIRGEGHIRFPDRQRLSLSLAGQSLEQVLIGNTQYTRLPGSADWQVQALDGPAAAADPLGSLAYLQALAVVEQLADETVGDAPSQHYRALLDTAGYLDKIEADAAGRSDFNPANWEAFKQRFADGEIAIEVWVSEAEGWIVQLKLDTVTHFTPPATGPEPAPQPTAIRATQTIQFIDFNRPVEIEPPI